MIKYQGGTKPLSSGLLSGIDSISSGSTVMNAEETEAGAESFGANNFENRSMKFLGMGLPATLT